MFRVAGLWRSILVLSSVLATSPKPLAAMNVCNAGFLGENSAQVRQRWPEALSNCPHPAAVVLFVGMNDAVNDKRFLSPAQTFEAVSATLREVAAVHAVAILVTVHQPDTVRLLQRHAPETYGSRGPARRIDDTNNALRKAALRRGAIVVDFHAVLARAGGANLDLSTDGVHLTKRGYGLLAAAVAAALPRAVQRETLLCLGDSLTYGVGVRASNAPDAGTDSYPRQLERLLGGTL